MCTFIENAPIPDNIAIWELPTDYYLHNPSVPRGLSSARPPSRPLTEWCSPFVQAHLPFSTSDANKIVKQLFSVDSPDLEAVDYYSNYHYPYRWTPLDEHIAMQIAHRARPFMPTYRTKYSPFQAGREVRVSTNPSMTGQSSTGSTASANSTSSSSSESSEPDENDIDSDNDSGLLMCAVASSSAATSVAQGGEEQRTKYVSFADQLPSMRQVYGCEVHEPSAADLAVYKRYVQIGKAQRNRKRSGRGGSSDTAIAGDTLQITMEVDLRPTVDYGTDCYRQVREPKVDPCSMDMYAAYVAWPESVGEQTVYSVLSASDAKLLRDYVAMGEIH